MIETYSYNVKKFATAFKIPPKDNDFWKDSQICFKLSFCPKLYVENNIIKIVGSTVQGNYGDYLVFKQGELIFVNNKIFKLKYVKVETNKG